MAPQDTLRQGEVVTARVTTKASAKSPEKSHKRVKVNPSLVHGPEGQASISLRSDSDPVRAWSGPEEYHLPAHVNRPQDTVAEDYHYHFPTFDAPDTYLLCYNPLCEQSTFVPLSLLALLRII